MQTVFVVDDEDSIQKLVAYNFQRAGFAVETASNGREAYDRIRLSPSEFDIVVLDLMLPGMDGLEVCKRLRQEQVKTPIILLTARDDEVDLVLGLEMGADDYVTKPFSPRELVARARAVLRRAETLDAAPEASGAAGENTSVMLRVSDVAMDLSRHEVSVRGNPVELTPKEFDLLRYLLEHREHVLSRDQLLDRVWGYSVATDTRIVDVHVSHLRDKVELDPKNPVMIRTVRGIGYKFTESAGK
ncbi:response regulator transcription factor [Alicyclobacillus tolerans]|uniref:response regulator transcription factor n=1 Tax=Alicyclobacillus tolerans TaxID=90970 RepID=UPI001F16A567|nr:response regulator transcription factor [Alicyclobacillus tolerans]MCF8567743.1 response regulator transcription factor [Alicyclobacillus tolerans]